MMTPEIAKVNIAFLIQKRYISDPEQLNQRKFKCAAQMRELLYILILPNVPTYAAIKTVV
jgi:hypothetical protein